MQIANPAVLSDFYGQPRYRAAEQPLLTWIVVTRAAKWLKPTDVKLTFNSADILKGSRVVFDIGGNKFRLVAVINYPVGVVFIRFIGTHKEYDKIDAQTI
jgi:mRNA interferase HigB